MLSLHEKPDVCLKTIIRFNRSRDGGESVSSSNEASYVNRSASPSNATTPTITIPSNDSQNFLPAHLKYTTPDQNVNAIPPYMPIQGIRRANGISQSDKKKKSKDNRCTHQ